MNKPLSTKLFKLRQLLRNSTPPVRSLHCIRSTRAAQHNIDEAEAALSTFQYFSASDGQRPLIKSTN
jgi:hypothetical protein